MLEVTQMWLTGADIKVVKNGQPNEINTSVTINDAALMDSTNVRLGFRYTVLYNPNLAIVNVMGYATCTDTKENVKKLLDQYKKNGTIDQNLAGEVMNLINANVGINSIFLIRPFGLVPQFAPPPIVKMVTPEREMTGNERARPVVKETKKRK